MDIHYIGALLVIAACGIGNSINATQAAEKSISIDRESHQIQDKLTYKKSFMATVNSTEFALLFEQKLTKQSSGRYWNISINGQVLGRLEAHTPQIGSDQTVEGFHQIGVEVPPNVLKQGEKYLDYHRQRAAAGVTQNRVRTPYIKSGPTTTNRNSQSTLCCWTTCAVSYYGCK
ncbi:MAG: hypothetical protein ACKVH8_16625 [Pirellulales bacterium]